MYRKEYPISHDLRVPKITVKELKTMEKYRKNTNKHGYVRKQSNSNTQSKNGMKRERGLSKEEIGRAPRASHPKGHTSRGKLALNQGERKAEKWGRRWSGAARVWVERK